VYIVPLNREFPMITPGSVMCGPRKQVEPLSYKLCYGGGMAQTITFRPDEDAERALEVLTADGTAVSAAVRSALIDAARSRAQQRVRAEAEALAGDAADRAEAAQVLRDMETLRAW
jgi:hypothetical protein